MVLVDTSVWIDHFRTDNARLRSLLLDGEVLCHQFVIGEVACGSLKDRDLIVGLLSALPEAPMVEHAEVLHFIKVRKLFATGIGWIDAHLLAGAVLNDAKLWTIDRRLKKVAEKLNIAADFES